MSNYPPGTWDGDPAAPWNQDEPLCDNCGEPCAPGEECAGCGTYNPTDVDYADAAVEQAFDRLREEGRL